MDVVAAFRGFPALLRAVTNQMGFAAVAADKGAPTFFVRTCMVTQPKLDTLPVLYMQEVDNWEQWYRDNTVIEVEDGNEWIIVPCQQWITENPACINMLTGAQLVKLEAPNYNMRASILEVARFIVENQMSNEQFLAADVATQATVVRDAMQVIMDEETYAQPRMQYCPLNYKGKKLRWFAHKVESWV